MTLVPFLVLTGIADGTTNGDLQPCMRLDSECSSFVSE
jgi:hypothetical protein